MGEDRDRSAPSAKAAVAVTCLLLCVRSAPILPFRPGSYFIRPCCTWRVARLCVCVQWWTPGWRRPPWQCGSACCVPAAMTIATRGLHLAALCACRVPWPHDPCPSRADAHACKMIGIKPHPRLSDSTETLPPRLRRYRDSHHYQDSATETLTLPPSPTATLPHKPNARAHAHQQHPPFVNRRWAAQAGASQWYWSNLTVEGELKPEL